MTTTAAQSFRLSPQQKRLWHLGGAPGGHTFMASAQVRLEGPFDTAALRRALERAVARHEILRTHFRPLPGLKTAGQVIAEEARIAWSEHELEGLDAEACREALERVEARLGTDGPDPAEGPVLAAECLRCGPAEGWLVLALPALRADRASLELLVAETARALDGTAAPEEPMQYADLAEWQNDLLEGEETASGRSFWQSAEWPAADLRLSFERRAAETGFEPRSLALELPEQTAAALAELAAELEASLGDTLFAAWQVLLARRSERAELTLGRLSDGRKYRELQAALGPFERTLPIACRPPRSASFRELVASSRGAFAEARQREEFLDLEEVFPSRGGGEPLSLGFAFYAAAESRRSGSTSLHPERLEAITETFALRLLACASDGGCDVELQWDGARFDRPDVEILAEQLEVLLSSAAAEPDRPLFAHRLWGERQERLLGEMNTTRVERSARLALHRRVAERAESVSEAVAIEAGGESISYGELAASARRLAVELRALGAGPERWVAVVAERSPAVVRAALAALEAGAAYLPLDPANPEERLRSMLEAMGEPLLLGAPHQLAPWLGHGSYGERTAALEGGLAALVPEGRATPPGTVEGFDDDAAELAAYAIFTSGSTGEPKAVVISHRAICNRLLWSQERYPLGEGDGVLQSAALGFDFSIWEIFAPLIAGARLILPPAGPLDIARVVREIARTRSTVTHFVPSLIGLFLDQAELDHCRALRLVFSGGEALGAELARSFFERFGPDGPELHNQYGPTEATIDVTFWPCARGDRRRTVPIGRPIANCEARVLDRAFEPASVGEPGELWVSGDGLARGYFGAPGRTAASFRPDPFSGRPGARLYRTGDLARLAGDGQVEFLGRADRQVQVRGVRVEPGEIEAILARHPSVREAVVLTRSTPMPRLLAWAATGSSALETAELLEFLRARLPIYMLPEAIVTLEALPRSASGKIDTAELPEPAGHRGGKDPGAAPRTATEKALAEIWAEVLDLEAVGADDDFFELGGHSLVAMRLLSRVRNVFDVEIPLAVIFDHSTVAGLAAEIDRAGSAGADTAPPLVALPRDRPLPLSPAQQQLWYLQQLDPASSIYNISYALELEGELDPALLEASLSEIARRHEVFRTRFFERDGQALQTVDAPEPLVLPTVELSRLGAEDRERERRRRVLESQARPFDLRSGRLLRASLWRLGPGHHTLHLVTHHISCDAWSLGIFSRELAELYTAGLERRLAELPALEIQYADFAAWQRRLLESEAIAGHLEYWREHLEGAPRVLELPSARPRPASPRHRGGEAVTSLAPPLVESLRQLARSEGASPFMVLLAVWMLLLRHESGQRDLVVGTTSASRGRSEIQPLIGFFINLLPLRTRLDDASSFRELLAEVRRTALGAFGHQDVPFDRLLEELRVPRERNRPPLVQVVLNFFQSSEAPRPELPGLTLRPLGIAADPARFDLVLDVTDAGERMTAALRYSAELFGEAEMRAFVERFERLAALAAERPGDALETLLGELAARGEEQRRTRRQSFAERRREMLRRRKEKH